MKNLVCNYSVIRFLPYPEAGEFVNIGVLACCPQIGWMNFIIERRKTKRINDFFPELDTDLFSAGRQHVMTELERVVAPFRVANTTQWVLPTDQQLIATVFAEVVRPREEIFRFGEPATLLTADPAKDLQTLFDHYVDRHFAKHKDYREKVMTDRLTELFRANNLLNRYRSEKVGNDEYHVTLPFVEKVADDPRPIRALKPLNLTQAEATQIRDHGDVWRNRVGRLDRMRLLPLHMLFAVQCPPKTDGRRYDAAHEICDLLEKQGVTITPFENKTELTHFAARTEEERV